MAEKELKRDLSLTMCMTLAIGAIIGAGIFSFTGIAINFAGPAVPIAFLAAGVLTIFMTLPSMQLGSAIPATGGSYMYVSRFVHPIFGYIQVLNTLIGSLNIAVMSISFSQYFVMLAPKADKRIVAITVILVFATASTFGVKIAGWVQNLMVGVMIIALLIYIIPGFSHIDPQNFTLAKMFTPLGGLAGLWGAIAILRYTTQGGTIVMALGDEVKNPGFTIPFSFFAGTIIVTIIYAFVGVVAVGVLPFAQVAGKPLAVSAKVLLNGGWFTFFIVGGGLFAITTTLNGSFLVYSRLHYAAAKDGIWPEVFTKLNKQRVPYVTLWTCSILSIIVVAFNISLVDVFKIVAVPGMLLSVIYYIPPILLPKKLPNCYKKAWFHMPQWLNIIVCVSSVILSTSFGITLFKTMKTSYWIGMIIFFIVGFIYWGVRINYLKKKQNRNIVAEMKGLHPYWQQIENEKVS